MHEQRHPGRTAIFMHDNIRPEKLDSYTKRTDLSADQLEPYDHRSIMHYDYRFYCMPKDLSVNYCDAGQSEGCVKVTKDACDPSMPIGFDPKNPTLSVRGTYQLSQNV